MSIEDVGAQAVRVHAAQDVLLLCHLTHHQDDALPVPGAIEDLPKCTEQGGLRPFRQAGDPVVLLHGYRVSVTRVLT